MAKLFVDSDSLISIADAIRTKGDTTEDLEFPSGFVAAVTAIESGNELNNWVNENLIDKGKPKGALFCNNKEITVIPETFDFSQLEEADFLFYNCINLEEIKPVIDFSRVDNASEWTKNCDALKEIRFVPDTIGTSETLVEVAILSPLLSVESISSILMGYVSGAITTLYFHSDVVANFTAEQWELIGNKNISFM